jgi:hypothetical protein
MSLHPLPAARRKAANGHFAFRPSLNARGRAIPLVARAARTLLVVVIGQV